MSIEQKNYQDSNYPKKQLHLILFILMIQIGTLGWVIYSQERNRQAIDKQNLKAELLEYSIDRVALVIDQQSSILNRAMGDFIQVRMPTDWTTRLGHLEDIAATQKLWPESNQSAEDYLNAVTSLVSEIPPWAERDYMARLNTLRWAAMAFATIHASESNNDDLHAKADTLALLGDSVPTGVNPSLLDFTISQLKQVEERADELAWQHLRQRASSHLTDPKADNSQEIQQDIVLLIAYHGDAHRRSESEELVTALQQVMLRREADLFVVSVRERINALSKFKSADPVLFETGTAALLNEVRSYRMNLALGGIELEGLSQIDNQLLADFEKLQMSSLEKQELMRAESVRAYQQYALRSIDLFKKRFQDRETIAERALESIRKGSRSPQDYDDLPSVWAVIKNAKYQKVERTIRPDTETFELDGVDEDLKKHLTYLVCRDAMVSHLLPVDLGLLELPVQALFDQNWQAGWTHLDGRFDQTYVAEKTVTIEKKSLKRIK